mgnify:CR=1 FL=1
MRQCLDDSPWCLWLDCDTFITNYTRSVQSIIHAAEILQSHVPAPCESRSNSSSHDVSCLPTTVDLIISEDGTCINTGVFLVRSTPWAKAFMDRLLTGDAAAFATHPFWDQAAV